VQDGEFSRLSSTRYSPGGWFYWKERLIRRPLYQGNVNTDECLRGVLTPTILPAIDTVLEAITRGRARLAGVEYLTAVRRYALTHGSLPDNLELATREAGLKAVPTDPYSGGPMHYKVIDKKPGVYSVGYDREDDAGTVDWDNGKQPGDFIFHIRE